MRRGTQAQLKYAPLYLMKKTKSKWVNKKNSSIYHFNNYIQMQNLNCILKIPFNNDELILRAEKIKTCHMIETKWGIRNCCQARVITLC